VGNVTRSIIPSEGLTQESYVVEEEGSDEGNNDFTHNLEDDTDPGNNVCASSLLLDDDLVMPDMTSARDILKPQMNEVLQCLDTLKSQSSIHLASKVLNNLANQLGLDLGTTSGSKRKRNIENCWTVSNINVEENVSKKSRTYASRNC
jgi:hypothetical protein